MGQLAEEVINADFIKVRHVCRHNDRMVNAAFQDQFKDVEIADGNALLDHFTWPQNMLQSLLLQKLWVRVCAVVRITITHHLHCHPTKLMCVRIVTLVFLDESHELSKRKGANTPPAHCI